MKIKVISDIHIGLPDAKNNDCRFTDDQLYLYIKNSLKVVDLLILNGDIFELWQTNFQKQVEHFELIEASYPKFFKILRKNLTRKTIIFINGNHDAVVRTKNLLPAVSEHNIQTKAGLLHFEHGHAADVNNSGKFSCFGQAIAWCGGMGETYIDPDIDLHFEKLLSVINGHNDDGKIDKLERHAIADAVLYGYRLVVYGHTHWSTIKQHTLSSKNKFTYANSGKGVNSNCIEEVIITTENKNLSVVLDKTRII
jgi:UDP-2,3-diacylglucosamine pyrophosphatase LpxH